MASGIVSQPTNDAYRVGHDAIFGRKCFYCRQPLAAGTAEHDVGAHERCEQTRTESALDEVNPCR